MLVWVVKAQCNAPHLHVRVVGGMKLFSQRIRAASLAPERVVLLRENDPRSPSDLIEVHMHVDSPTHGAPVHRTLDQLRVPHGLTSATSPALVQLLSPDLLSFRVEQELGLLSRVEETGFIRFSQFRAGL